MYINACAVCFCLNDNQLLGLEKSGGQDPSSNFKIPTIVLAIEFYFSEIITAHTLIIRLIKKLYVPTRGRVSYDVDMSI